LPRALAKRSLSVRSSSHPSPCSFLRCRGITGSRCVTQELHRRGTGWFGHVGGPRYNARVGTDRLVIHGAREHNLKHITLDLPRGKLIVFTGLSGSGKSSLAFDTIYAEGQRRYVESLSSYARQFLGQMENPDVDFIEGLS